MALSASLIVVFCNIIPDTTFKVTCRMEKSFQKPFQPLARMEQGRGSDGAGTGLGLDGGSVGSRIGLVGLVSSSHGAGMGLTWGLLGA